MPDVYHHLNHRIIDCSSITGLAERWLPELMDLWRHDQRTNASYDHRALNDCESSIQSLRWIRKNLFVQGSASDVGDIAGSAPAAAQNGIGFPHP